MSDVSVIGLGLMGNALAGTLLSAGHAVCVWNRSPEKAERLVDAGAVHANSPRAAIEDSKILLICVKDYAATREFFDSEAARSALAGRIVVQLSTGVPAEAIDSETWFDARGAAYLDGAILASPQAIGNPDCQILIAGNEQSWRQCQPVLQCLAGNFQYTGEQIDSAAILDLAWLSQRLGLYMGVFQGLLLCTAGGVGADVFASTVAADERTSMIANTVHCGDFDDPVNTVAVWHDAFNQVLSQARNSGTNCEVLEFIEDKFRRAKSLQIGDQDMAALIKVFNA